MAIKWGLTWGLLCRNSGRGELYIVRQHSCLIYGIWMSKEVGNTLKLSFGCGNTSFILSLTGYCKRLSRISLFPILLLFYLFCIYWDWQDRKQMRLTLNYSVYNIISLWSKHLHPVSQEYIYCNWKFIISE